MSSVPMIINYEKTKADEKTFSVNNIYYHSKYSAKKEAERFVQNINYPFNPKLLLIIEPGYDYIYPLLKTKFTNCKIGIIRLLDNLKDNSGWDFKINYDSNIKQKLEESFESEELLSSNLIIWQPNQNLFADECSNIFNIYKEILEYNRTLLVTREHFEKRWITNSFIFAKNLNKIVTLKDKINKPVLITASGPSLYKNISIIKKYRNKLFILSLSSSLSCLLQNDIKPDLILSTDGGYWAKEHLKKLSFYKEIPIALTPESALKTAFFNHPILPLNYPDGISSALTNNLKILSLLSIRCGTVSGTALYLAKQLTENKIFFSGLDLSSQKGFQHMQPNELEANNSLLDNRINSAAKRLARSEFNSESLKIYENWFKNLNENTEIFRIIDNPKNSLGKILDISSSEFDIILMKTPEIKEINCFELKKYNNSNINTIFNSYINKIKSEKEIQKLIFPADFISLERAVSVEDINKIQLNLNTKISTLITKLKKISND